MNNYIGEIAALGASFFWAIAATAFAVATGRVGAVIVNRIRLVVAVVFLSIAHIMLKGQWLPSNIELYRWFWLGLSGVAAQVVGNTLLFQSMLYIGPRRTTMLMSLLPVISTVFAWGLLGERLDPIEMFAVALAVVGTAWAVSEREHVNETQADLKHHWQGILLALLGTFGEAWSLVAAKKGVSGDFDPLTANLIRMTVAAGVIWIYTLLRKQATQTFQALTDRQAMLAILGGAAAGPVIAVSLSFVALRSSRVGIVSTFMSLQPVFLLLPSAWIFREQIGLRAVVGTLIAVGGAAILFLI